MSQLLSLDKGHYLGKIVDMCYADGIIAGATTYPEEVLTSQMHYHDNLHVSFVLQGGSIEKRIGNKYERLPGNRSYLLPMRFSTLAPCKTKLT